eukprot:Sspe_Gene.63275::Locus_36111_Transcript_1_1_Confidence_1.000_Length_979::g.63275::m.63275
MGTGGRETSCHVSHGKERGKGRGGGISNHPPPSTLPLSAFFPPWLPLHPSLAFSPPSSHSLQLISGTPIYMQEPVVNLRVWCSLLPGTVVLPSPLIHSDIRINLQVLI